MAYVRAYLRASSSDQHANRARVALETFSADRGLPIVAWYVENQSGATLERPELFRLLADAHEQDICLVEQVDRLSRLTERDWTKLKALLAAKEVRVVALDLPTSWLMFTAQADEFTGRMFQAINGMMLDMLAAIARKDYLDRRRRQSEGITRAKTAGLYRGREEDRARNTGIATMLKAGASWSAVQGAFGCSRDTIARVAKRMRSEALGAGESQRS